MNKQINQFETLKTSLPIILGYLGIGASFGIMARAAGLDLTIIMMISAFVYAGSVQFALITMLSGGTPLFAIMMSVFLINSRVILMSTTIAHLLGNETLLKKISVSVLLTDETFALSINKASDSKVKVGWLNRLNLVAYVTWLVATLMGAIAGGLLKSPEKLGLKFAIIAMFIGLLWLQVVSDKQLSLLYQISIIIATLIVFYIGLIVIPKNILIIIVPIIISYIGAQFKNEIN